MAKIDVTTYYLEMRSRQDLRRSSFSGEDTALGQAEIASPELNRFLYTAVGAHWYWLARLSWTYEQWMEWLDRPELETWLLYKRGTPAGYFELEQQQGGKVELAYFGLLPQFVGQGLGSYLLTKAVERAWDMENTQKVWVHTCTLDHKNALTNYRNRGFVVVKKVSHMADLPPVPPQPWPKAARPVFS